MLNAVPVCSHWMHQTSQARGHYSHFTDGKPWFRGAKCFAQDHTPSSVELSSKWPDTKLRIWWFYNRSRDSSFPIFTKFRPHPPTACREALSVTGILSLLVVFFSCSSPVPNMQVNIVLMLYVLSVSQSSQAVLWHGMGVSPIFQMRNLKPREVE